MLRKHIVWKHNSYCSSLSWCTEVDSPEFSELSLNLQEAQAFRATTVEHIRTYLALDSKTPCQGINVIQTATRSSIIEEFAPVGHAMVKHYTLGKALLPHVMRLVSPLVDKPVNRPAAGSNATD